MGTEQDQIRRKLIRKKPNKQDKPIHFLSSNPVCIVQSNQFKLNGLKTVNFKIKFHVGHGIAPVFWRQPSWLCVMNWCPIQGVFHSHTQCSQDKL